MNFAVINAKTNKVENIINTTSTVVDELQAGLSCILKPCDDIALMMQDDFNSDEGKFYRDGIEVDKIPTVEEQILTAIDAYTLELIEGGLL